MSIDYKAIGKNVRTARLRKKLTQEKLGEYSCVEPTNISHIERGATKVSLPTLVSLANTLEVTLDELLYGNIKNDSAVSAGIINETISDCTPSELRALTVILTAAKTALRSLDK